MCVCGGGNLWCNTAGLAKIARHFFFCFKKKKKEKKIEGFSTLKANHFVTSLFKFRFCFAGGRGDR